MTAAVDRALDTVRGHPPASAEGVTDLLLDLRRELEETVRLEERMLEERMLVEMMMSARRPRPDRSHLGVALRAATMRAAITGLARPRRTATRWTAG